MQSLIIIWGRSTPTDVARDPRIHVRGLPRGNRVRQPRMAAFGAQHALRSPPGCSRSVRGCLSPKPCVTDRPSQASLPMRGRQDHSPQGLRGLRVPLELKQGQAPKTLLHTGAATAVIMSNSDRGELAASAGACRPLTRFTSRASTDVTSNSCTGVAVADSIHLCITPSEDMQA